VTQNSTVRAFYGLLSLAHTALFDGPGRLDTVQLDFAVTALGHTLGFLQVLVDKTTAGSAHPRKNDAKEC